MEIIPKAAALALDCIRGQMDPFCLAGGTGLSLFYLQHRVSFDLDLFNTGGNFSRYQEILFLWEQGGFTVESPREISGGEHPVLRSRLWKKTEEIKVDWIDDPVPLASSPEDFDGIRVMGIDDIYYRKILIDVTEGQTRRFLRFEARDVLDLYALSHQHQKLSQRLVRGGYNSQAARNLHWWLSRFPKREIQEEIKTTQYQIERSSEVILHHLKEEIEEALSALLKREGLKG